MALDDGGRARGHQPSSPRTTHFYPGGNPLAGSSPTPFGPPPTVRSADSEWLGEGEIPFALVDTARQMPVVRGAWWRYRETSVREAVVWSQWVFTDTVTGVRRIAGDEVGVQRSSASGEHYADVLVPYALIALPHEMWNGSGASHGQTDLIDAVRRWLQTPDPPGDGSTVPSRARPPAEFMRIPPVPGTQYSYWEWTEPDLVAVRGPAAEFQGCSVLRKIQGGGNVSSAWWWPGVGFVRMLDPGCGGTYGNVTVTQLEAWHIPQIVAVP